MNALAGTEFKVVTGYPSGKRSTLRSSAAGFHGRASNSSASSKSTRPDSVREKKLIVLVQVALERDPDLKDIPTLIDLVGDDIDRKFVAFLSAETTVAHALVTPPRSACRPAQRAAPRLRPNREGPAVPRRSGQMGGMDIEPMNGEEAQPIAHGIVDHAAGGARPRTCGARQSAEVASGDIGGRAGDAPPI